MFQLKHEVYKVTQWKDDCIFKTEKVTEIWLDCKSRSHEEETTIARENGGDLLQVTTENRVVNQLEQWAKIISPSAFKED